MAQFPPIPFSVQNLTNKVAVDLFYHSKTFYKAGSQKIFQHWICSILHTEKSSILLTSLISRTKAIIRDYNKAKCSKDVARIELFENDKFLPPVLSSLSKDKRIHDQNKLKSLHYQLSILKSKLHLSSTALCRANQAKKRKQSQVIGLKKKIKTFHMPTMVNKKKFKCTATQTDLCTKVPVKKFKDKDIQCNLHNETISNLTTELTYWQNRVLEIEENAEDTMESFDTREEGRGCPFSAQVREAVYDCLQYNVPKENVSDVIKSIVGIFTPTKLTNLPSKSTVYNMSRETELISQYQLKEVLKDEENLSIMRDATTKYGHHYYGVKLCTEEKEYTLGFKEISSGSADKYIDATMQLIEPIDDSNSPIITKISNTMTDRSATEKKTNTLLAQLKFKKLKDLIDDVEELPDHEKAITSFHCSVHPLLQFAEEAEKVVKEIEKENNMHLNFDKSVFKKSSESFTHNLLRITSKLFFDDKSGDPLLSSHFMNLHGIKKIPVMKFKGNRFNTYFYNAAGVFIIHQLLHDYLTRTKVSQNNLQAAIIKFVNNPTLMSICQAIGLCSHHITSPYFQLASSTSTSYEMSPIYEQLISGLNKISQNPELLLSPDFHLFSPSSDTYTRKQEDQHIHQKLFQDPLDKTTILSTIKRVCNNLNIKCTKLFSDFIPGGKLHQPSTSQISSSQSCPSNNISLERMMGQLDRYKHISPNISIPSINAKVMFKNNNTSDWLKSKDENIKTDIITNCRKTCESRKEDNLEYEIKLQEERSHIISKRTEDKQKRDEKISQSRNNIITKIGMLGGKWTNTEDVQNYLQSCTLKKDKLNSLKLQISYRKDILNQKVEDKKLFYVSEPLEKLQINLEKLIYLENAATTLENLNTTEITTTTLDTATSTPENLNTAAEITTTTLDTATSTTENAKTTLGNATTTIPEIEVIMETDSNIETAPTTPHNTLHPPAYYEGKQILHTWDDGNNNLTEYDGKITQFSEKNMTFTVKYWNSKIGKRYHKRLQNYIVTWKELQEDIQSGDLKIMQKLIKRNRL